MKLNNRGIVTSCEAFGIMVLIGGVCAILIGSPGWLGMIISGIVIIFMAFNDYFTDSGFLNTMICVGIMLVALFLTGAFF